MKTRQKATSQAEHTAADLPFEKAVEELEGLLERMETGQLSLEASLAAYRRGAVLLRHCQSQLDDADQRLNVLEDGALKPLVIDTEDTA